jgi:hypothetical protein
MIFCKSAGRKIFTNLPYRFFCRRFFTYFLPNGAKSVLKQPKTKAAKWRLFQLLTFDCVCLVSVQFAQNTIENLPS